MRIAQVPRYIKFRTGLDSCLHIPCKKKKRVKIRIFVLKREQKWQIYGNLLMAIVNCLGAPPFEVVQGT